MPCVLSCAGQIHHVIEGFVREQIRLKLQIADGQVDSTKLKAMVKHWSQQMSAAVNREASRNITREASQMVDKANSTQRQQSSTQGTIFRTSQPKPLTIMITWTKL